MVCRKVHDSALRQPVAELKNLQGWVFCLGWTLVDLGGEEEVEWILMVRLYLFYAPMLRWIGEYGMEDELTRCTSPHGDNCLPQRTDTFSSSSNSSPCLHARLRRLSTRQKRGPSS